MTVQPFPVVFATGQLLTAEVWAAQAVALDDRTRLFADNGADDSIAGMARRLLDAAPERFDLVAHAMGGFVAFELMRTAPGRVRRLALLGTLAPADTPEQNARREGYLRLVREGRFAAVVEERIPILVHPDRRGDDTIIGPVRRMAAQTGPERFLAQQRAIMTRLDSRPGLGAIACPVLLIRGREDAIASDAHQQEMLAALPAARLATVDACGHLATLERPEAVNALLRAFLDAAEPG